MRKFSIPSFLISVFLFFVSGSIFADSPCKDLSESKCNANNDCTWVKGYQKESGAKVDDYCRARPGKGDDDDSKSDKKDKKKDKDDDDDSKSDKKDKKKKDKDDDDSKSDKKDKKKKDKDDDGGKNKKKDKKKKGNKED